jgi:hypothetical protein
MNPGISTLCVVGLVAACLTPPVSSSLAAAGPVDVPARHVEPVVLTGAHVPTWSRLPAQGIGKGHTYGTREGQRDAHAGQLVVPPDARQGVPVEKLAAYAWVDGEFQEIPVQVDERFPYFLANGNSDFGIYSGTDEELTYAWDVESWKKTAGECEATYPEGETTMGDPVATLDDDDEIVFMADDAGGKAPSEALGPLGSGEERQEVRLIDPRDPSNERYVYLFLDEDGSSFDESNGYVDYQRDADADEWIDRDTFTEHDPEKLGSSNTGYGPNMSGSVCTDDPSTPEIETQRQVGDRFPRDGITVATDTYKFRATGRWMVRGMQITKPGTTRTYGPDLIDRWKGRAFQQSPDSTISVVGFEDEQVNWEANSALLGELEGPVRAIREVWGADSGTNVTKTETFYRDAVVYRYRVRVHPIPPDGLYTSWDYNHDVASTYFNETKTEGVPVDGRNDEALGNIDEAPNGDPAFFDAPDPTFTKPLAFFNWEQVSGRADAGSLVYMFEFKNAQSLENPAVVPYYRDDACLDDGTGDDPSPRLMPGESYAWMEDEAARTDNDPGTREASREYLERPCYTQAPEGYDGPYKQGCFGCHGVHYFFTHDTDNAFGFKPVNEIDGQQWQWAVPTAAPTNVGDAYANTVKTPLVAFATAQTNSTGGGQSPSPTPTASATPSATPTATPSNSTSPTPSPSSSATAGPTVSPPPSTVPSSSPSPSTSTGPSPSVTASQATTAPPQSPGTASSSIETSRDKVNYLRPFTLSGRVETTGACTVEGVRIHKRAYGTTSFRPQESLRVDRDGFWGTDVRSATGASYVAEPLVSEGCEARASDPVDMRVRVGIDIASASCRRVEGRVSPNHRGTRIVLHRREAGAWNELDRDRLNRSSRFTLRPAPCEGRFRVSWPTQSERNSGSAETFRI